MIHSRSHRQQMAAMTVQTTKMRLKIRQNENRKVAKSTIDSTISETNSKIKMSNTRLQYSIDKETQRISIKIIDKDTDKVIREVPPEETLEADQEDMGDCRYHSYDEKR